MGADLREAIKDTLGAFVKLDYAIIYFDDIKDDINKTKYTIKAHKENGTYLFTFGEQKEDENPCDKNERWTPMSYKVAIL